MHFAARMPWTGTRQPRQQGAGSVADRCVARTQLRRTISAFSPSAALLHCWRELSGRSNMPRRCYGQARTNATYLSPHSRTSFAGQLGRLNPSTAHANLYVCLSKTDAELGLTGRNLWVYLTFGHDANVQLFSMNPDAELPGIYLPFPPAKDPDFQRCCRRKNTTEAITLRLCGLAIRRSGRASNLCREREVWHVCLDFRRCFGEECCALKDESISNPTLQ